jgi:hypothetical protein
MRIDMKRKKIDRQSSRFLRAGNRWPHRDERGMVIVVFGDSQHCCCVPGRLHGKDRAHTSAMPRPVDLNPHKDLIKISVVKLSAVSPGTAIDGFFMVSLSAIRYALGTPGYQRSDPDERNGEPPHPPSG